MRGVEKLAVPAGIAGAAVLFHAFPMGLALGPAGERVVGRAIVLLFVAALLVEALRMLPAPLRARLTRRRALAQLGLTWVACSLVMAWLAGVVLGVARAPAAPTFGAGVAYGPLTAWPHVEAAWPALGLGAQVGLGRVLMVATTGFLLALCIAVARERVRSATGRALRAWPALIVAPGCPGCLTPALAIVASVGGSALAPALRPLADPLSQASIVLEVAAPLLALLALARLCDTRTPRPASAALARASTAAALVGPALAAPLLRNQLAFLLPEGATSTHEAISGLFVVVTIAALLLFLPVLLLILYYPTRYRERRAGADAPPPGRALTPRARHVLIAVYTLVPAVVILGLGFASTGVLYEMERPPEGTMHVNVTGEQFNWTFTMPDDSVSENVLRVPVDEVVVLHIQSTDVVHSFFVPQLGVHMDAQPHHATELWFRATRTGEYAAHCAEFCGFGHTQMRALVVVEPR